MTPNSAAERIESLKAGIIGMLSTPIALLLTAGIALLSNESLLGTEGMAIDQIPTLSTLVHGGTTALSGFLFGVTYRYIVRQDTNPQLKTGAVMAFGLVRGLAQLQIIVGQPDWLWTSGFYLLKSVLLFSIVALVVDWAMQRGWVKPFGINSEE